MKLFSVRHQSILSASVILGLTFVFSAVLGFVRSRFLYAQFFSCCTWQLDAYNAAFRIPDLIFKLLVTGALSASFIPVYSSLLHKDPKTAHKTASSVINLLILAFIILSSLALIFTPYLTNLIAAGFTPEQIELMTNLTRILLIAQIFFLISNFLTGILQVNQYFLVPALSPILYNVFIILSIILLSDKFGIYGVTIGSVVGAFFHMAIQITSVLRTGYRYSWTINTQLSGVKEIIRLMVPRSLSLGLGEIENTVTLFFSSTLASGSLSILNLAMQFMYLPSRVFATTIGQASLPALSKNVARNELNEFRATVKKILLQSLFVAIPISAIILVQRLSIIRLAYGAKEFPWTATLLTSKTLAFMVPAIASQAVIQILVRSFYALHNTKTPLKISAISLVVNILTSYLLTTFTNLGVLGLAVSASLGNLTQAIGLLIMFIRIVDGGGWWVVLYRSLKIFFASIVASTSTWIAVKIFDLFILDTSKTFHLMLVFGLSCTVGVVVYYLICLMLKIEEIESYQRLLNKFLQLVRLKK